MRTNNVAGDSRASGKLRTRPTPRLASIDRPRNCGCARAAHTARPAGGLWRLQSQRLQRSPPHLLPRAPHAPRPRLPEGILTPLRPSPCLLRSSSDDDPESRFSAAPMPRAGTPLYLDLRPPYLLEGRRLPRRPGEHRPRRRLQHQHQHQQQIRTKKTKSSMSKANMLNTRWRVAADRASSGTCSSRDDVTNPNLSSILLTSRPPMCRKAACAFKASGLALSKRAVTASSNERYG